MKDPIGVLRSAGRASRWPARSCCSETALPMIPKAMSYWKQSADLLTKALSYLPSTDPILVNALQRYSAVALQKSVREGFGLWRRPCEREQQ